MNCDCARGHKSAESLLGCFRRLAWLSTGRRDSNMRKERTLSAGSHSTMSVWNSERLRKQIDKPIGKEIYCGLLVRQVLFVPHSVWAINLWKGTDYARKYSCMFALFLCTCCFPYTTASDHFQRSNIRISTQLNELDLFCLFRQGWTLCKWYISTFCASLTNLKNNFLEGCQDHKVLWDMTSVVFWYKLLFNRL